MPDMQVIKSRENPHAKRLDSLLRQKKAREESGMFALEGSRLCLDALQAGLRPESIYLTPSALQREPELAALVWVAPQIVWLDETLAQRLGDTMNPQGVFSINAAPEREPIPFRPDGRYLLLHQVRDPGNLGAILRTAAALGADGVVLDGCAELYSPKVLRAAMGGIWRIPLQQLEMSEAITKLRRSGIQVYAAALRENANDPMRLGSPGRAVLIGNEGAGLPEELINACDGAVMLPMQGGMESLNAAMAAGILLWEMTKLRQTGLEQFDSF